MRVVQSYELPSSQIVGIYKGPLTALVSYLEVLAGKGYTMVAVSTEIWDPVYVFNPGCI